MADMYGAVSSNEFKVKNFTSFRDWFEKYSFGDEIELSVVEASEGPSATVSFGGYEQYPNAYPMIVSREEDGDWVIENREEEADLDVFATELRSHLAEGEIFQVVATGNEKLRYVGFSELIVAEDVPKARFHLIYSDGDNDSLRARLTGSIEYSTMEQAS